jgi:signal transduction histidine kinase
MVQFLFDREKRQEAARVKELRELLGKIEQADFWGRMSKGLGSGAEERDSFQQAIMRRAKALGVTPEKLLSNYAQLLRESTYPTPECLEPEELQEITSSRALTPEQSGHLQNCVPCQQLLKASEQSSAEKSALKDMVQKVAAQADEPGSEMTAPNADTIATERERFRDSSTIKAGQMELDLTEFDLPTMIDTTLTLVREQAESRGIKLHRAVDRRLGQIRADEWKMQRIMLNLLSNAIKFTPEGGRIEVRAEPVDAFVKVSVNETEGLTLEDQQAVFEEFRQLGTSAAKREGPGLGLALCRRFVELHGGKLWVRSPAEPGPTFEFRVPLRSGLSAGE